MQKHKTMKQMLHPVEANKEKALVAEPLASRNTRSWRAVKAFVMAIAVAFICCVLFAVVK